MFPKPDSDLTSPDNDRPSQQNNNQQDGEITSQNTAAHDGSLQSLASESIAVMRTWPEGDEPDPLQPQLQNQVTHQLQERYGFDTIPERASSNEAQFYTHDARSRMLRVARIRDSNPPKWIFLRPTPGSADRWEYGRIFSGVVLHEVRRAPSNEGLDAVHHDSEIFGYPEDAIGRTNSTGLVIARPSMQRPPDAGLHPMIAMQNFQKQVAADYASGYRPFETRMTYSSFPSASSSELIKSVSYRGPHCTSVNTFVCHGGLTGHDNSDKNKNPKDKVWQFPHGLPPIIRRAALYEEVKGERKYELTDGMTAILLKLEFVHKTLPDTTLVYEFNAPKDWKLREHVDPLRKIMRLVRYRCVGGFDDVIED
ncbi:hypothetical protein EJ08DRAFT_697815 [Tothia fuscella]|uniref:Uncharacterized protein n=1 Tax=Tothia fuscella TaxID=1048955 RepID=A0A9P4NQT4_9PEZI|nr:hypothetical protein EJ08DRAFT_697815 [Tothia fuscella]